MSRVLLSTNVAYWPSVGGSERVLHRILQGVRADFDRVIVFAPLEADTPTDHEGVELRAYSQRDLRRFASKARPDVYFPNMIHSAITYDNLRNVSGRADRTIVNMIGGYPARTSPGFRSRLLNLARDAADVAVHVDPHSVETAIDRAMRPDLEFTFVPQGLDHGELDQARDETEPRSERYFAFVSNLWSWKRPELFLTEVAAKLPSMRFRIAASARTGDIVDRVVHLARAMPNVDVHLGLERPDFLRVIAGAEGVLATSEIEGAQPNTMLEAGYLGVPYLALYPGQNFAHYPHVEMFGTVAQMVERLRTDGDHLREIRRESLARAQADFSRTYWTWPSIVNQYRRLFNA